MDYNLLIQKAREVMNNSYSPYSGFRVGAAVLCSDGKIYTGTNVENASFGAAICAERSAIVRAVSDGSTRIRAIAVASGSDSLVTPCGICRQVIAEFADKDTEIICGDGGGYKIYKMNELLPEAFDGSLI